MELQTVWSGSHKHVYLCVHEPAPLKPVDAGVPERKMARHALYHWLSPTSAGALSTRQLVELTGYERGTVNSALYQLKRMGQLASGPGPHIAGAGPRVRRQQVYWRAA